MNYRASLLSKIVHRAPTPETPGAAATLDRLRACVVELGYPAHFVIELEGCPADVVADVLLRLRVESMGQELQQERTFSTRLRNENTNKGGRPRKHVH